ncbi:efflux transporter outer membrane subunit [Aquincola sp. MAHUQ-54]|uniref:Efflux transporter outer membrane subunit n=1 Tax=Aquincola agrisoli TaxID=3119538 RepID=A0AAW9QCJ1_9BURK
MTTTSDRLRGPSLPLLACLLFTACASPPPAQPPADTVPPQWQAALPHGGEAAQLAGWWARFDDPLLAQLIDTAQRRNPTLAQAAARIAQARASVRIAGAAARPTLAANVGAQRSDNDLPGTTGLQTAGSATLDAAWEIDLFGATRQAVAAAQARADGADAQWHNARVSLAAEVAGAYVGLRSCEAVLEVYENDARSGGQTASLTQQKVDAGFEAPANAGLARAAAAEAANRVVAQRADCDLSVKQLAALTVEAEPVLRGLLAERRARLPQPASFAVEAVPAQVLAQRPDVAAAEREIAAASADVGAAHADRFPRLSLTGSIGRAGVRVGGDTFDGRTWSFGPALLAPLVDGGRRVAAVDAAQGRYDEAVAGWRERVLAAAREVEEALVRLEAAQRREQDAQRAASGYAEFLAAAQTQWQVGTGSLLDLEQARRSSLGADAALIQVRRERVAAWLALYKAVGGGWQQAAAGTTGDSN